MNHLDKDIAIRARIKQAMEGHVTPALYFVYGCRGPSIAGQVFDSRVLNITGPHKISEATVRTVGAYTRK